MLVVTVSNDYISLHCISMWIKLLRLFVSASLAEMFGGILVPDSYCYVVSRILIKARNLC